MSEKRTIKKYRPSREDVIRVEVIELPKERLPDEGLYSWKFRETNMLMDYLTLEKELNLHVPKRTAFILDRLQNMRRVYINLTTGEVSS